MVSLKSADDREHVGDVQRARLRPDRVWLAEYTADYLLDVGLRLLVRDGCQDIGERAVPALAQRLHRDDEPYRTFLGHEIHVLELVHVAGAYRYLLVGDAGVDDLLLELAEGLGVVGSPAFRLEQDDGADVASRLLPFPAGDEFQAPLEQYGVLHHFAFAVAT